MNFQCIQLWSRSSHSVRARTRSCRRCLAILLSFSAVALAQIAQTPKQTSAQEEFDRIKGLSGNWEGLVTTVPKMPQSGDGNRIHVVMRVTSRGNALMHEIPPTGVPDDPTSYDHPLTMLYLDGDRLLLTHYCDAGNRPRMAAHISPDNKTVQFELLDVAGSTMLGHMQRAAFTFIDNNHHTEDWTYIMPDGTPLVAHFDLRRLK